MLMIPGSGFGAKITPRPFQPKLFQLQARKRRNRGLFQALSAQKRTIFARLLQDSAHFAPEIRRREEGPRGPRFF